MVLVIHLNRLRVREVVCVTPEDGRHVNLEVIMVDQEVATVAKVVQQDSVESEALLSCGANAGGCFPVVHLLGDLWGGWFEVEAQWEWFEVDG